MRTLLVWMVGLVTVHGLAGAILFSEPATVELAQNPDPIMHVFGYGQLFANRTPLHLDRSDAPVQGLCGLRGIHAHQDAAEQHREFATGDVRVTWASGHGVSGAGRGALPEGMRKPFTDARAGLTRTRSDRSITLAGLTDRATLPLTGDRGLSQGVSA